MGLESLAYEMTSIPRETCATFDENDYVLEKCSQMAVPMRICLDVGHRNLGGTPEEADYLCWIRRYGKYCSVIDCQQSDMQGSRHWPFTPECNAKGIIQPDQIVSAIEDSGAEEILLAFELRTSAFHPQEYSHLESLKLSVDHWRQWVKE